MDSTTKTTFHLAVYFSTIIATLLSVYLVYFTTSFPLYLFWPLILVSALGWFHFLRLVVTCKSLPFDRKMVWFIAIFSFYIVAAPLFYFFVIRRYVDVPKG